MGKLRCRKGIAFGAALALAFSLAACGSAEEEEESASSEAGSSAEAESEEDYSEVASPEDMTTVEDVVEDDMTPVYASQLVDGTYEVTVDSSSSMFSITECLLTVADGEMTAVMTMSGTGYLYVYMGTGEEAAEADESEYIAYEEDEDGVYSFTVPVEALDSGISCAAFSRNKEMWYDRTLVFRSDSLPSEAFADGTVQTVEDLGLEDGNYTAEVTLEGGSGRASVESPAAIRIEDGQAYATIIWSSSNYDYMMVDDEQYLPTNTEGNSTFEIPIEGFDWKLSVTADTTAMSQPYEISYMLYFDSSTLEAAE